ncbi:hypothetical protein GCM10023353_39880 [Tomitella cavernea]|uniref:Mobilization protein n=1 Tax=Tomitella cavernea TaxID=1387982 RepID=A0ABP9D6E5_9ACTN
MADADGSPVRRTRTVAVRLTDAEHAAWRAAAAAEGRRQLGAWIRRDAVGLPVRHRPAASGRRTGDSGRVGGVAPAARAGRQQRQPARPRGASGADVDVAALEEARGVLGRIADAAEAIETGGQS